MGNGWWAMPGEGGGGGGGFGSSDALAFGMMNSLRTGNPHYDMMVVVVSDTAQSHRGLLPACLAACLLGWLAGAAPRPLCVCVSVPVSVSLSVL